MFDRRTARVGPELEAVRAARRFVRSALEAWGLPPRDDLALVVSELVTNALQHAVGPIEVTIQRDHRHLRLEVCDGSATHPVVAVRDPSRPGGLGMIVVQELSVGWGANSTQDGGKTVWVEFDL